MKKILLFIAIFYLGFVLFMPKINLYYTLENFAKKEHVVIKEGAIKDRWIDLEIKDATVFYDGIASLEAKEIDMLPWIFYNKITLTDVSPSKTLKSMFDAKADEVTLTYSVLSYKTIMIAAHGDFGELVGTLDVMAQKIHLVLSPSEKFKNHQIVRQYFKKQEEGLVYESKL